MAAEEERGTVLTRDEGAPVAEGDVLDLGTLIAGYTIEAVAGFGGMGVVYRAADVRLGRSVALKLIAPERAGDQRFRELFVQESLTAASLEHPSVIPIYQAGESDGRLYIAMRFVDGASLQDLIVRGGPLPAARAARIVAAAAGALDAAHARGLVHRDVKPGNILIADPDGDEQVYLTDFGLARPAAADGRPVKGWSGTLAYLAPEQVRGEPLDARTDVYALGCTLFHALTGRVPFPGADADAAMQAHLSTAPPDVRELAPGVPPALAAVVATALAKRPEDRFGSAGAMGRAALAARFDVALHHEEGDDARAAAVADELGRRGVQAVLAAGAGAADAIASAGACAVLVGRAGLGAWARHGLGAARDLAARDRAFRLVTALMPGAPDPLDPRLSYLADCPWADLREGIEAGADDLVRTLGAAAPPALGDSLDICPYQGLAAFGEEQAELFVGRERDVARLVERLRTGRFVAVVGPSGSGKSSLVHAGLVPALRRAGGPTVHVVSLTPGAAPLASLAAALASLCGEDAPTADALAKDRRALDRTLEAALLDEPASDLALVVVDQLEEAFTLATDPAETEAFFANLVDAATIPGGRAAVVVAMRADFYHRLADHPELRALVSGSQQLVGPLETADLRRAIEEPAKRVGLELEPGLTRRIVGDVADRPGTLPLLGHLLRELWLRRRGRTLTLAGYGASGGVAGALARTANGVYEGLSDERKGIARRVLLRLTQPGEGTEDTRRRATASELVSTGDDPAEVQAVVDALAEARLVTTGKDEATGDPVVEVTHEALIRGWPELRGWIDEDRDTLRLQRRLADAAQEWDRAGREEGLLYRGARLAVWDERDRSSLNQLERDFLAVGADRARRERAGRRRRIQLVIAGLLVAVAAISVVAGFALVQRNTASDQRDEARSRQLASDARAALETDPELAVLLADRAYGVEPTPQAEEVLREATFRSTVRAAHRDHAGRVHGLAWAPDGDVVSAGEDGTVREWTPGQPGTRASEGHEGAVLAVAISPDGATIASAGTDGTVRTWDRVSGRPVDAWTSHEGAVYAVAFSPDGGLLAAGGDDTQIRIWDVAAPSRAPRVLTGHEATVKAVAFSPDGRFLASGGDELPVRLWDLGTGSARLLEGHSSAVYGVAFSPDGTRLVSASGDRTLRIWTLAGGSPPLVVDAARIYGSDGAEFSRDGRFLVSAGLDGTVRVWDAAGTPLVVLRGHAGQVDEAHFSPDGRRIVTSGEDGSVRVWDWAHELPIAQITAPLDFPIDGGAMFLPDGRRVLSVSFDGSVREWDPASGGLAPRLRGFGPDTFANTAALSPDGTTLATTNTDSEIVIRPVAGGPARVLSGHEGRIWAVAFSPDGSLLATGGEDLTVRIWDLRSGTSRILRGHEAAPAVVRFSRDGRVLASAGEDATIRVWDTASGREVSVLRGHEGPVQDVDFSPDGRLLVSGGTDRTVRVWTLADGASTDLLGHENTVYTAAFDADGSRVVSTADDGVRVWDWARGATVLRIPSESRDAYRAALSPDGSRIAVQTIGHRILLYPCETCGGVADTLRLAAERVTRELTPQEAEAFDVPER